MGGCLNADGAARLNYDLYSPVILLYLFFEDYFRDEYQPTTDGSIESSDIVRHY